MNRPPADPGTGRDDAPPGSEDWAKRLRLSLQTTIHAVDIHPESLRSRVEAVHRHEAWRMMNKADGSYFGSFAEFCEYREPWGLGRPWDRIAPFVGALKWFLAKPGDPRPAEISAPAPLAAAESISIAKIVTDGGTQPRASIDDAVVEDYAEKLSAGAEFPPVVVFFDGSRYWLADGFHRVAAAIKAGRSEIAADVRQGDRSEAIWFSCGANATHGKPRSNSDKRRAVETALKHPKVVIPIEEGKTISDRFIAEACAVHHDLVGEIRRAMERPGGGSATSPQVRTGKDGNEYPASQPASREKKKTREKKRAAGAAGGRAKAANRAAAKAAEQAPEPVQQADVPAAPAVAPPPAPPLPAPKQSAPAPSYDQVMAMLEPGLRAAELLSQQLRESVIRSVSARLRPGA